MMTKNEIDELSDEDKETIANSMYLQEEINQKIASMVETSVALTIYDIDVSASELKTMEIVTQIFRKRILLTRNINPGFDEELLRNRIGFLCARYGYQFIAVEDALEAMKESNPYGSTDPHTMVDTLKRISNSNKTFSR